MRQRTPNKFQLVLCEIHNTRIHGFDENSDPTVQGHYLLTGRYYYDGLEQRDSDVDTDSEDDMSDDDDDDGVDDDDENSDCNDYLSVGVYSALANAREYYRVVVLNDRKYHSHPFLRNYSTIFRRPNYIQPEIAQCVYLAGCERVAILKTFWLRIVQRAWKRVFKERKEILRKRMCPQNLREREIMGKWPMSCRRYPGIYGMLALVR
jgi:hypothetical protein